MESKVSARKITAREREAKALELRRSGCNYAEIGARMGITEVGAWYAVKRAMDRSLKLCDAEAERNRQLDLQRLDVALNAIWDQVKEGRCYAIDRLIRVLERRARLLGLDRGTEEEQDIGTALAQLLERLAAAGSQQDE